MTEMSLKEDLEREHLVTAGGLVHSEVHCEIGWSVPLFVSLYPRLGTRYLSYCWVERYMVGTQKKELA